MPGVLIIEAMAQVAAILGMLSHVEEPPENCLYYLAGVDKVRFRKTVVPGDQLLLEARLMAYKKNIWKFEASAKVNDHFIASSRLLTTIAT